MSSVLQSLVCLWGVLLLTCSFAWGQSYPARAFERFTPDDGLSIEGATGILQDRQGFLWVGTIGGLNRFDGYHFQTFRHDPADSTSLADDYVNPHALLEDPAGQLWIGTVNGLDRYDPATNRFFHYRHDPEDTSTLSHANVTALLETTRGQLWVGTVRGLNLLDRHTGRVRRFLPDSSDAHALLPGAVNALLEDRDGRLWVGTRRGLHLLADPLAAAADTARVVFRRFTANGDHPIPDDDVFALHQDRQGRLWVGGWEGGVFLLAPDGSLLRHFPPAGQRPSSSPGRRVVDIFEDPDGSLWFATWGDGLARYDPAKDAFERIRHDVADPGSLASDQVVDVFRDRTGVLWVATWEGLNKLPVRKPFRVFQNSPDAPCSIADNRVSAVIKDRNGALWVGTSYGLDRLRPGNDPSSCVATHYGPVAGDETSLSHAGVSSLLEDRSGFLWVGTYGGGLNRSASPLSAESSLAFIHYRHEARGPGLTDDMVYSLYEDTEGAIWIGTVQSGLSRLDPRTDQMRHYRHDAADPASLSFNAVWPVFEDRKGTLWVGTVSGGLNRMDADRTSFTRFSQDPSDPTSLNNDRIISMTEDRDGTLWIGTMGGGLSRLDHASGRFDRVADAQGAFPENAACILPGNDADLWVATTDGLIRLNPSTEVFSTYGRDDGLPSTTFSFNACDKANDGELVFGTSAGVVAFYPSAIRDNGYPPPVAITGLNVFNTPVRLDSSVAYLHRLVLPYDENFISFEYAALDFTFPAANAYAYRLEGVNDGWVYAGARRFADYPNLSPGTYTFRVKASNADGIWNEAGASLMLVITPPFWMTWWFRVLLLTTFFGLVAAAYWYNLDRRLAVERTRQTIAADLHDTIGSRLGSIALRLDMLGAMDGEAHAEVEGVSRSVRSLTAELRDTLWVVDAGSDRLDQLLDRMRATARDLLAAHPSSLAFPEAVPPARLDMKLRRNLISILREALHNVIRHARASLVVVSVQVDNGVLTLSVEDDGVGFDVNTLPCGRGMETLRRRARESGGDLVILSRPGNGTTIRFSVGLRSGTHTPTRGSDQ